MVEHRSCEQNEDKANLLIFIFLALFIAIILIWLYMSGATTSNKSELVDSDCYMHLIRVLDLRDTGRWYDPVLLRSNAPYGETLHWSRPFDILLLLAAVPLSLVMNFESALFWWGVIISPVLMTLTLIALHWTTKPVLSKDGPFLIIAVFFFQLVLLAFFQAGRPDHHSLLIFVFVLSIGFTFRIILKPLKIPLCYIAGAIGALSMWISVESMLPTCAIIAALALLWVLENGDFAGKSLHYTIALFVITGLSLTFERAWYNLAAVEFDRLSIVHWTVFAFITLFWIAVSIFNRHTNLFHRRVNRLLFSLTGLVAVAPAMLVCFPKFYSGPFADIDPRIFPIWFSKISEVQPLLSDTVSLTLSVQIISSAVVCFPFLLYLLSKRTGVVNRKAWICISILLVVFFTISVYQIRWAVYTQVLLAIVVTELMCRLLMRLKTEKNVLWRYLKRGLVIITLSTVFFAAGVLADKVIKTEEDDKNRKHISLVRLCAYLNEAKKWNNRNLRILTHPDFGAEILYRTRHEVIGTANRYGPGILDTYDIMTADTDGEALKIIKKRRIDAVLLCPESTESSFYSNPNRIATFYQRLRQNMAPHWLRKAELPDDLSSSFTLFEIIEN